MTRPQPPCPRCGLVPVWPYGCPCGHVSASGAPAPASPPPYPGASYPGASAAPAYRAAPPPYPYGAAGPLVYRPGPPVVSEKSAGVAVLLTFVWLGAGHLYLNRTTPGVLLMLLHVFLVLIFLVPFVGWVLGFLGWLVAFIAATVSCSSIANEENARARSRYR